MILCSHLVHIECAESASLPVGGPWQVDINHNWRDSSKKNKEKVLKEFNETKKKTVLLMSLKDGGVGLNLTAASNVFLMDPWWNPAVEEQAIMRIHRIGQKRTVNIRRFIVTILSFI
ncbi:hypothetical protein MKW98_016736 [Papaver atlanticum]|uniref:Helicase C-terminal domain-containing protein n=1 Tax=Papaver atlanticum TaxID=357466 RepID=A0AAD4TJM5_9MAGN|nr:hypothetical protein MKW98_016736 [Papaver atlanticum]